MSSTTSLAQKASFSLGYRIGFDHTGKDASSVLTPSYDHGTIVMAKIQVWKKAKLFLTLGYDLSSTRYQIYNDIFGPPKRPYPFNVVKIRRNGFHLGLNKQFSANKFTYDIGFNGVYRKSIYFDMHRMAQGGLYLPDYVIRSFHFEVEPSTRSNFGFEFNVSTIYQLSKKISVYLGVNYSAGHFIGYRSSASYADNIGTISIPPEDNIERGHYIYTNTGIIYGI